MTPNLKPILRRCAFAALAMFLLAGCGGADYIPVFFPPPAGEGDKTPSPDESAGGRQCTISFTSQMCVKIKNESSSLDVGTKAGDELCAEVPAFPIHISGSKVTLKGSEFPDIKAEGHGLPAPITINARGSADGSANTGEGTIDASGNITIQNFSLFIVALGVVGEIPGLTLTTGSIDALPELPAANGSPPDAAGAMTLITGTVLGSTIEAADKILKGASIIATFSGAINPQLTQCGGSTERSIEVKGLVISKDGKQTETPLADGKRMEVSSGTYIADSPLDVGDRFATITKFRIRNVGNKPQSLQIPPRVGPFHLRSIDPLTRTLAAGQTFILTVEFRPTSGDKEGEIREKLPIGSDQFELVGKALAKAGRGSVSAVGDDGTVTLPDIGDIAVGEASVQANTERAFFLCKSVQCGEMKAWSGCSACDDPENQPCELLPVATDGRPIGEVDAQCKPMNADALPLYTIDLKGTSSATLSGHKQVLAIRNKGAADITVTGITIEDVEGSKSKGEFKIPPNAIFIAKKYSDIQGRIADALAGKKAGGLKLPFKLTPFLKGYDETSIYVVVTYEPLDLIGADGKQAGVGSKALDKAIVKISTDSGEMTTAVTGSTTIEESPALELYFKTSSGTKQVADGGAFPMRGVTAATRDLALPLFLRVADSASKTLRITSISIEGGDAANFRWLDSAEKIAGVRPESGKGMRCSIPIVDETTAKMTSETFDLKPVSLTPPGFDMAPGAFSTATMPLFGCVDFHREEGGPAKRLFETRVVIQATELAANGMPTKNPDGSPRQTKLIARLLAAINPKSGPMVLRITQTGSVIMNAQTPSMSSGDSQADTIKIVGKEKFKEIPPQVFTGAMIMDPFDELPIMTSDGKETASRPNDGGTLVFRAVDTHPVTQNYENLNLFNYAHLTFDATREAGHKGIYEDYPNYPPDARANGWRIFTSSLSYPGPLAPRDKSPSTPNDCVVINPCDPAGLKLFTEAGANANGGKGACAFFYASGGRYDSPAYHSATEMEGGDYAKLCNRVDKPQKLIDMNAGHYTVDGRLTMEEIGLRFFGPTHITNPGGPMGPKPPMDEVFHTAFTTGVIKPQSNPNEADVLPEKKIDHSKNEYKINLTDKTTGTVPLCDKNTKNRVLQGKTYSVWRYLDGLLFKDEEGTIPAGCPDDGNKYTGGLAYLKGKDVDPETGTLTLVAAVKFSSSDDLTFAFKDTVMFVFMRGWLCDPAGKPEDFEGARCFDAAGNDRDAVGQISIMDK